MHVLENITELYSEIHDQYVSIIIDAETEIFVKEALELLILLT